jgi:hypothetical protein
MLNRVDGSAAPGTPRPLQLLQNVLLLEYVQCTYRTKESAWPEWPRLEGGSILRLRRCGLLHECQ